MDEEELAGNYDNLMEDFQCFGDDAIFGLVYPFLQEGQEMLDVGIGTGLSSIKFRDKGIIIDGIDKSASMISQCQKKGFTRYLVKHDILEGDLPFPDSSYDHVISAGVLHFFKELDPIFKEVSRVLRKGGSFTLTVMAEPDGGPEKGVASKMTKWGKEVFLHGRNYVESMAGIHGFKSMSWLLFVGSIDSENGLLFYNWVFVLKLE